MAIHETNNLYSILADAAIAKPGETFLIYDNVPVSYAAGIDCVHRYATFLKEQGVRRGDRVIINLGNAPEFIYFYLALCQIGAISVLVGPLARRYELQYIISDCRPVLVITTREQLEHFSVDGEQVIDISKIICIDENGESSLHEQVVSRQPCLELEVMEKDSAASIIYTSAMDGFPAGAMLPHIGIYESTKMLAGYAQPDETFMAILPLYHAFGLTTSFILPTIAMKPFHIVKKFSPLDVFKLFKDHRITVFIGVPRIFALMNKLLPPGPHFPDLRYSITGGEGIEVQLMKDVKEKYNIDVRQGYGLTEASPIVTWHYPGIENRLGSVGKAMPWNEVRVVKKGTLEDVPAGTEGEIIIKGMNVMPGYYNKPEKTAKALENGWLHTGDAGKFDKDGYLYLTGIDKEMTLNHGFNVYPKEVERILSFHPAVKDINVTIQTIETQDGPVDGIVAGITRKDNALDENAMKLWCKDNISSYKVPKKFIVT